MKNEGILTPEAMIAWKRSAASLRVPIPPRYVIICPQDVLPSRFSSLFMKKIRGLVGRHLCIDPANGVYLSTGWGIGGAALIAVCEELRVLGAQSFIQVGLMGRLDPDTSEGDVVYGVMAQREEGTSRHYLEDDALKDIHCTSERYFNRFDELGYIKGKVLSTDAPYRETKEQVRNWRTDGCSMIDMETASLYAFATFYSLEAISVGIGSDSLFDDRWAQPQHYEELGAKLKKTVYQIAEMIA